MNSTPVVERFRFGENWQDFAATVGQESIAEAQRGLLKLFPSRELNGARMLDIGCGSGLSMLAALRLGAAHVHGIDIDEDSIVAARKLLSTFAAPGQWSVEAVDLFDFPRQPYNVVYSWGVLHHTGAMWRALERATSFVRNDGLLAIALYRHSPACSFWRREKKLYSRAPRPAQAIVRSLYKAGFLAAIAASGRSPFAYVKNYRSSRGMSFHHDVHDWLGGHPYESATPGQVADALARAGFSVERAFTRPVAVKGIFGSHCDEYVARLMR